MGNEHKCDKNMRKTITVLNQSDFFEVPTIPLNSPN